VLATYSSGSGQSETCDDSEWTDWFGLSADNNHNVWETRKSSERERFDLEGVTLAPWCKASWGRCARDTF